MKIIVLTILLSTFCSQLFAKNIEGEFKFIKPISLRKSQIAISNQDAEKKESQEVDASTVSKTSRLNKVDSNLSLLGKHWRVLEHATTGAVIGAALFTIIGFSKKSVDESSTHEEEMAYLATVASIGSLSGQFIGASSGVASYLSSGYNFSKTSVFMGTLLGDILAFGVYILIDNLTDNNYISIGALSASLLLFPPLFSVYAGELTKEEKKDVSLNILPPMIKVTNSDLLKSSHVAIYPVNILIRF